MPRQKDEGASSTVADLSNKFLHARRADIFRSGELSTRQWYEYRQTRERVVAGFGRIRPVADLTPDDLGRLKASRAAVGLTDLSHRLTLGH